MTENQQYADDLITVRRVPVHLDSGVTVQRTIIGYRPAAAILPMDDRASVLLIRHYRHPIGRTLWEIPGGLIQAGETPHDAAARELMEETGYRAQVLAPLMTFNPEPAFTNHQIHLFVGRGLQAVADRGANEYEISDQRFVGLEEIEALIRSGAISSSWTLIALLVTFPALAGRIV